METNERRSLFPVAWALCCVILVALLLSYFNLTEHIKTRHDETQMMVMDELMDLRTNISKLRGEILHLRRELKEHDTKPEWWERKEDDGSSSE